MTKVVTLSAHDVEALLNYQNVTKDIAWLTFGRAHVRPINHSAWAIGTMRHGRMHVRRIVWGRLMARSEKRDGEIIRRAEIFIKLESKKRERPRSR